MARKTYPENRKCEQCGATLSIYNPHDICFAHRHCPEFMLGIGESVSSLGCALNTDIAGTGNKIKTASVALALTRIEYEGH
ncbi:MAG: hypothetical protein GF365_05435 [Candidatus Buchananbacteria bacterium]|nr:hypothetical protein [Candidatus Buchananbacteria bacterium]